MAIAPAPASASPAATLAFAAIAGRALVPGAGLEFGAGARFAGGLDRCFFQRLFLLDVGLFVRFTLALEGGCRWLYDWRGRCIARREGLQPLDSEFRRHESVIVVFGGISSAVTIHGPKAPVWVKFLPAVHWMVWRCQSRTEPSL